MTRPLGALLLFAACAHPAPPPAPRASTALLPEPVRLTVRAGGELADLVPATLEHSRARLEAAQHAVNDEAPIELDIEIVQFGGVVRNGAYQYCVQLVGRVVRDGAQFAATDVTKERCEVVRFTNGGTDPVNAALAVIAATTVALTFETTTPNPQSHLYLATLDELTDTLGHRAVRRD
jgi:hypothetical protein